MVFIPGDDFRENTTDGLWNDVYSRDGEGG